jgi:antitoxin (DNA-binding transcriptional repressor) of toxin-antitoxin stability system
VKDICSITDLQREGPSIVRRAEAKGSVPLARNGRTVAYIISRNRMEAIIETLEIMGNREAMKAISDYQAGRVNMRDASVLDED